MLLALYLRQVLALQPDALFSDHITSFQIAGMLDLAGLLVAIWTIWSTISLTLGGRLLLAFRFMAVGALAFVFSHLLDTLLQGSKALDVEVATFLHQGVVTIAIFLFVAGLANLADDLPGLRAPRQMGTSLRLWPFVVGAALCISLFSFIIYGFSMVAEVWAFIWLEIGLILLLVVCLALVLRARLGGVVGRSLWLAMLGLFIFGMAHPVQVWFYLNSDLTPGALGVLHRLVVIPAFFLFAISITRLGQQLDRSSRAQAAVRYTSQITPLNNLGGGQPAPRHRPHPR